MSALVHFPKMRKALAANGKEYSDRKPQSDVAKRLRIRGLPHDETGPLIVAIPGDLAARIRSAALWAQKHPERYLLDWLLAGFPSARGR
jgi:hypothetical protein